MFFLARIRIRIYSESYIGPNTNTNIFVMLQWTKYEYSNIFGSNIRIFLVRIFESHFGQTFKYSIGTDRSESLYSRNTKVTIMLLPLSKLYSVAKLSPAQSKFNPVAWAELALI